MLDRIWTEFQSIISIDDGFKLFYGFQLFYDDAVCSDHPQKTTIFQNIRRSDY